MKIAAKKSFFIFFLMFSYAKIYPGANDHGYFFSHERPVPHKQNTPSKQGRAISPPATEAEYTFLILVQASNNLESFAQKNMKDMMKWGSTPNVNILVDLHKTGDKSWRYKVEQGACVVDSVEIRHKNATIAEEVLSTAKWAITKYPAKKYAIVFWNHGYGCISPQLETNNKPYTQVMNNSWRSPLNDTDTQTIHTSRASRNSIPIDRSILFDDERNIYLSTEDLQETLKTISQTLLGGKKIDLVGMDACLMGMMEIANQIKEYVDYFVASEEFEFAHGWPYGAIIEKLTTQPITPKELGQYIVTSYENYYTNRTSYFTQACIDLSKIAELKNNIDGMAQLLVQGHTQDPDRMKLFIHQARSQTLSFSLADYVDIHSLYQELLKVTQYALDNPYNKPTPAPRINQTIITSLHATLTEGIKLLNACVVQNCTGRYLSRARGLSLYFPQKTLDPSYIQNEFAQTTQWINLLMKQIR
ncbi:MAG: clostripain-related cysteine peptidase [bacterium]